MFKYPMQIQNLSDQKCFVDFKIILFFNAPSTCFINEFINNDILKIKKSIEYTFAEILNHVLFNEN